MTTDDRAEWNSFTDVYVRLSKDELGYPPKEWEQLKAEALQEEGAYRLKSIPVYAKGLAWDDEVLTGRSSEGYFPVVNQVVKRSGYSTMRLSITSIENKEELIKHFTSQGVYLEFSGTIVALAIPSDVFGTVSDYICTEMDKGRWDAEDGYLVADDTPSQ